MDTHHQKFEEAYDGGLRFASTRSFVKWWRTLEDERKKLPENDVCRGIALSAEITQRVLLSLYAEFCEIHNVAPLSDRQLLNKIKSHGVRSRRPPAKIIDGKMRRPTMYGLSPRRS